MMPSRHQCLYVDDMPDAKAQRTLGSACSTRWARNGPEHLQQALLNYFIRAREQSRWDRDAERLRGLDVDDQLELRRLLDGHVGGFRAFENLVNVDGGTAG